ncbi:MAG TPA: twin-arginine translocase TatA/TatE family subunit [Thermoleophilaceae bacterium]|nr:twin-arginine translocase TatA/TatE family subunit [Thermoleophilaceae bacterium]
MELVIVMIVALLILGPKRLPEMGRSVGQGMRSFKNAVTGGDDEPEKELPEKAAAVRQ